MAGMNAETPPPASDAPSQIRQIIWGREKRKLRDGPGDADLGSAVHTTTWTPKRLMPIRIFWALGMSGTMVFATVLMMGVTHVDRLAFPALTVKLL
jgi:hypothetical protein